MSSTSHSTSVLCVSSPHRPLCSTKAMRSSLRRCGASLSSSSHHCRVRGDRSSLRRIDLVGNLHRRESGRKQRIIGNLQLASIKSRLLRHLGCETVLVISRIRHARFGQSWRAGAGDVHWVLNSVHISNRQLQNMANMSTHMFGTAERLCCCHVKS